MRLRPTPSRRPQRRRLQAATLALAGVALIGAGIAQSVVKPPRGTGIDSPSQLERALPEPDRRAVAETVEAPPKPQTPQTPVQQWKQMPAPVRITIPAIGVSAPIIRRGLSSDGSIETPDNVTDTGWFAPGPEPGEKGAAVIVGHVDSYQGPGVFYHLRALRRGDRINVVLSDRRRLPFVVTGAKQAPKNRFPAEQVFAHTNRPTLRLITCGGLFDESSRHYVDNYIVFARLIGNP